MYAIHGLTDYKRSLIGDLVRCSKIAGAIETAANH